MSCRRFDFFLPLGELAGQLGESIGQLRMFTGHGDGSLDLVIPLATFQNPLHSGFVSRRAVLVEFFAVQRGGVQALRFGYSRRRIAGADDRRWFSGWNESAGLLKPSLL